MVKYPCSNCGEEADSVHGCPSCGRTPQQEVAALGLMITQMQLRYRDFTDERVLMGKRLQAAITRRTLLQNEVGAVPRRGVTGVRRGARPNQGGMRTPVRTYAKGANGSSAQNQAAAHPAGAENRRTTAAPIQRRAAAGPPPPPPGEHHAPETSTTSSQNVLLWLGALLLAVAAVVLTVFLEANLGAAAGELILVVFTGLALAAPRFFVRSRLTATAETIAAVAIVFVLLDGYNIWLAGWLDGTGISVAGYAGFVCLISAGIAAVYRTTSHLVAPRFAAVLLVQPVMPLLGFSVIKGISAWATVISAVAAANLALALVLTGLRKRDDNNLIARVAAGFRQPLLTRHTPYLLDAVWVLHAVGVVVGVVCAVVALGLADTTPEVLGGAAALLIAAVVGMGGGLLLRRNMLPDLGVALATLAVIGAFGRVAAVVAPGRGLLVTALAALATGWALHLVGVLGRPSSPADQPAVDGRATVQGRRGARWAGLIAVVTVGVLVTLRGLAMIIAPVRAALPAWYAHLDRYPDTLARATHGRGVSLCLAALVLAACAIMVSPGARGDVVTAFGGLAVLLAPAAFGLPWLAGVVLGTVAALAAGAYSLAAASPRSAWVRGGTALVVGAAAAGAALARPGSAAVQLVVLALGGAVIGSAPRLVSAVGPTLAAGLAGPLGFEPEPPSVPGGTPAATSRMVLRARTTAADLALGGAAFALPGAVACATAALVPAGSGPRPILAATFLAVAGTLVATALSQVAWDRGRAATPAAWDRGAVAGNPVASPGTLIAIGASLGAAVLATVALSTHVGLLDRAVALLLLVAGLTLFLGPWLLGSRSAPPDPNDTGELEGAGGTGSGPRGGVLGRLRAPDVSAVVVTTAAIAAVTRVGSLIVPSYALVSAAVVVLLVAAGIRAIPPSWRRGPIMGAATVATIVGLIGAVVAVRAGIAVLDAIQHVWHTDLTRWSATVPQSWAGQVPLALVVLAAAAALGLPRPWAQQGVAIGLGLAALAAPATLGLAWWAAIALSGIGATIFGIASAATRDPRVAWVRFAVAGLLFADTVGASLVQQRTTTTTLFGAALINGAVAVTAVLTRRRIDVVKVPPAHLTLIGGGALSTAILTVPAAFACLTANRPGGPTLLLTAALAGLCVAFAVAGLVGYDDPAILLYVTIGVAAGGTVIAIGTLQAKPLPVEVYAAAAALIVVLSELLRSAVAMRRAARARFRPRASDVAAGPTARRNAGRPGFTVGFAAGPATVLAVVWLAPRLIAALFGPYQQVNHVWPAQPPVTAQQGLGQLAGWAGNGTSVVAALLLTIAAALGAIGFGGSDRQLGERAVAVVIPGAALTLLIAPAALRLAWAAEPLAALLVAALCGLGVALTRPPARRGSPLRDARRIIVLICILSAGAGLAGALATRAMTITSLAITVVCGLVAAVRGQRQPARIIGWLVAGVAGHLLALVVSQVAELPVYQAAFVVAAVAAGLLVLAALLPRLRSTEAAAEAITVEATAYAGAFFALLLASRSYPYLATFCTAWGVVLAIAATRPNRSVYYRRALIWFAAAHEVVAWWLYAHLSGVHLLEAYSLGVAAAALVVGWLEIRQRPELSSWAAYGFSLVAAFLPSLTLVFREGADHLWRPILLIVGAAATVAIGSVRRQQAPIIIGSVTLVLAALRELALASAGLAIVGAVLAIAAIVLVALGATTEQRRRRTEQLRGAWGKLR